MRKIWKKELEAYMTLEASFIIPLAFICFIVIILYIFYLYNHLTVYQSCYQSALRGSQLKNVTDGAVRQYVNEEITKLLDEQVYQYQIHYSVDVGMLGISVGADSKVSNSVKNFDLYKKDSFDSVREVSINRIDPVDYIRNADRFSADRR